MKSKNTFRNILRILGTISVILYILFLIGEGIPLFRPTSFADISVYLLFLVFLLGYYFLWKNELMSGIILIAMYGLQWLLVFTVWVDGGLTLIIGFPILIIGILKAPLIILLEILGLLLMLMQTLFKTNSFGVMLLL